MCQQYLLYCLAVRKDGNQSICRDQFKTWVFSGFPSGKTIRCLFVVVFLVYFFFPLGFEDELQLGNVLNKYLSSRNEVWSSA